MQLFNDECIVLKSRNYKDSDKYYTFFARNHGKVTALARGVRKILSKRSGDLDTLNTVVAGFSENTKGFKILTEVKSLESFSFIKKSLEKSVAAYYIVELVYRFVEEETLGSTNLYNLLSSSLHKLNLEESKTPEIVGRFELAFVHQLGYKMPLSKLDINPSSFENALPAIRSYVQKTLGSDMKSLTI